MKKILILSFVFFSSIYSFAYSNNALYEKIEATGKVSSELYYNLGNAYYKINKVAPSIYNFEGNWTRLPTSGTRKGVCTQISDRYYTYDNAGGVAGVNQLTVTFINVDDSVIYIPFVENASPSGLSVKSFQPGTITDGDNFSWSLSASGFYGTFTRNFTRE